VERRGLADVDLDVEGGGAERRQLLLGSSCLVGLVVGDDDRRARLRQVVRHAAPDALPRAGHDDDPPLDAVHGPGVLDRDLGVQHGW
jgi:hypothetical protein